MKFLLNNNKLINKNQPAEKIDKKEEKNIIIIKEEESKINEFLSNYEFLNVNSLSKYKIKFLATQPTIDKTKIINELQNFDSYNMKLKESIIILLDYYGENAENLIKISSLCKKCIVIDHHETFIEISNNIKNLENFEFFFNKSKSAFPLVIDYFLDKTPNFNDIIPLEIQKQN